MQADFIAGNDNRARTDIEAKLDACICQTKRDKVTSTFILAIVQNQTWTDSNKYIIIYIYSNVLKDFV